jgi:glycosyltransferase involved in cell wall biosynthesis
MGNKFDLCVLIPAYNEGDTPISFSKEIISKFHHEFPDVRIQVVIIDDGSQKQHAPKFSPDEPQSSNINIIRTNQNLGKDNALYYGLKHASSSSYYCAIDGDGEQPSSLLIDQWRMIVGKKSKLVIANRETPTSSENIAKRIMRKFVTSISKKVFMVEIDGLTDCIMFEERIRDIAIYNWNKNKLFKFIPWRIFLATFLKPDDSITFEATRTEKEGGSRFSNWRLIRLGLRCLLLNPKALTTIVYSGLIFCITASILPLAFVIVDWVSGTLYPGYMTITALLTMILWSSLAVLSINLTRLIIDVRNLQSDLEY